MDSGTVGRILGIIRVLRPRHEHSGWLKERLDYGKKYDVNLTRNRRILHYGCFSSNNSERSRQWRAQSLSGSISTGSRHPQVYATKATHDDPTCRLAVRVTGKGSDEKEFPVHPISKGEGEFMRANTLVELMEGVTKLEIPKRPRRCLFWKYDRNRAI